MIVLQIIQVILGMCIAGFGMWMMAHGPSVSIAVSVIVVGILVALNSRKRKKESEEDGW